jgi:hypothetical protein
MFYYYKQQYKFLVTEKVWKRFTEVTTNDDIGGLWNMYKKAKFTFTPEVYMLSCFL